MASGLLASLWSVRAALDGAAIDAPGMIVTNCVPRPTKVFQWMQRRVRAGAAQVHQADLV